MFDSKRNVLFYLQPSAIPTLTAPTESGLLSTSPSRTATAGVLADDEVPLPRKGQASLASPSSPYALSSSSSRRHLGTATLPALSEELVCTDLASWLRFCNERRRGSIEDAQRYGVLNRKVVEVQSILLPPSPSLLDPSIFPLLRSVKDHPNIWGYSVLRLEEAITGEVSLQIVREHLPAAVDLETIISHVKRGVDDEGRDVAEAQIPLHTRLYMAWHCALGLRELHARGIAHGDLCQANILVDVLNRECKLANFGLNLRGLRAATVPDNDGTVLDDEEVEQTDGSRTPLALAADIYAFGVLLFEILALQAVDAAPFPLQLSGALASGTLEGDQVKDLIASCLDRHPDARPDIRSICQALERLILDTLLPTTAARDIWKEAVALEASLITSTRLHNVPMIPIADDRSSSSDAATALATSSRRSRTATGAEDRPFGVSWASFERAAFLRSYMREDGDGVESTSFESLGAATGASPADYYPRFNKMLALYVVHHLIADWNASEVLALSPTEINARIGAWGLDYHLKGALAHVRQDVLLKKELAGRVRLSSFLHFLRFFPLAAVQGQLLDKVFALVADRHFQAVQTLDEAKLLLNEQPIGTFVLHFVRAVPGTNEAGYCATWVEDKTPGEPTVYLGCAYFTRSDNNWCLGEEKFAYLDELLAWLKRDKVLLLQPYRPSHPLECLKLAWYAHEQSVQEVTLGSGFTAARLKVTSLRQKDEQFLKNNLHPDARRWIKSAEITRCIVTRDGGLSMKMKRELIARSGYLLISKNSKRWERRLVDLVEGFAVFYTDEHSKQEGNAVEVMALEGLRVHVEHSHGGDHPAKLVLRGGGDEYPVFEIRPATISLDPTADLQKWAIGIQYWAVQGVIHDSYVPVRRNVNCRWFVDGRDAFYALAAAIAAAQHNILLSSWRLVPEMYMRRIPPFREDDRFDRLLQRKAREGVKIYILLWKEPKVAMDHGSATLQEQLMNLHPNIKLLRHPHFKGAPAHPYSHHQKAMVVDYGTKHVKGFVGGMDVAFGRWDNDKHVIVDENRLTTLWPGADYFHVEEPPFVAPFKDIHDREKEPRCGWHDIMMSVDGEAAVDLAYNFLQRWNQHRAELLYYEQFLPASEGTSHLFPVLKPLPNPFFRTANGCRRSTPSSDSSSDLSPDLRLELGGMAWAASDGRWRRAREMVNELRFGCLDRRYDLGLEDPRRKEDDDRQRHRGGLLAKLRNFLKRPFSHSATHGDVDRKQVSGRHRKAARVDGVDVTDVQQQTTMPTTTTTTTTTTMTTTDTTGEINASRLVVDENADVATPVPSAVAVAAVNETTGDGGTATLAAEQEQEKEETDRKGKAKLTLAEADERDEVEACDPVLPELLLVPEQIRERERERIAQLVREHSGGWDVNRILTEECRVSSPEPYTQMTPNPVACSVQMVRGMAMWSGSNRKETSLSHAHFALIQKSKHFIYIENQFFISRFDGGSGPQNAIGHALVSRIGRAALENEPFRVMILLPAEPAMGPLPTIKNREIIGLQHNTIWKGPKAIFKELQRLFNLDFEQASKYISFHALRSHGHLFSVGPVTESVYIHAKLLIIDDREAIIGSANINDRSLDGYRDSELAAWVKDDDMVAGRMGGRPFSLGRFCHSLRMSLWKEHLGIENDDKTLLELISDPVSKQALVYWDHVSHSNTELYERIFPYIPQNSIQTLEQLEWRKDAFHRIPFDKKMPMEEELKQVRGHLTNYALTFLEGEHLEISLTDSPQYLPFKTTFY